ncbi:hypothetical protein IEQ34_007514 [Dendrobium chrysotoxum]|uniref:Uncharacterized protein n=1 Tax=Dendrobium chrysotoxum TaxID=161865 RepID=A0AAV7H4X0_DENCH|nr:hypothetical protein IEQ34_007514 [Dendrobium chrysotoxum]
MAYMFLDPIMEKLISAAFRYLKDQVRWQTGMKEDLVKLQENLQDPSCRPLRFQPRADHIP